MLSWWKTNRLEFNRKLDQFFGSLVYGLSQLFFETGQAFLFGTQSIRLIFQKPSRWDEVLRHMEFIGNKSVIIICLTGGFTGLALSYQIYLGFKLVNATNLVGPTVALGITRELGPVLTGLIVAARAGGAMAARLGTMRVSEQIDALEVMGFDSKQYLVAPRILAAFVSMPLLCAVFDFVAMVSAGLLCVKVLGIDEAIFWDKIQQWIEPGDIYQGMVKAAFFGLTFASICTNKGYFAKGGAKGVGEATNQGVVNSMVLVIISNYFLTNLIRFFYVITGLRS
ncbi:MAG: ABC transporter permease [Bdellovibrionales bacterium]|nr:ABC transporter permease [Bdellovibrionales bacterium]